MNLHSSSSSPVASIASKFATDPYKDNYELSPFAADPSSAQTAPLQSANPSQSCIEGIFTFNVKQRINLILNSGSDLIILRKLKAYGFAFIEFNDWTEVWSLLEIEQDHLKDKTKLLHILLADDLLNVCHDVAPNIRVGHSSLGNKIEDLSSANLRALFIYVYLSKVTILP